MDHENPRQITIRLFQRIDIDVKISTPTVLTYRAKELSCLCFFLFIIICYLLNYKIIKKNCLVLDLINGKSSFVFVLKGCWSKTKLVEHPRTEWRYLRYFAITFKHCAIICCELHTGTIIICELNFINLCDYFIVKK